ncbi:hypothetical protein BD289DRAFT_461102 [Coniella lustricola]|uniref:DUF8035 domain-containing protein n=1 Tax=Coniella lustricola TaxID=2025994 RepID=A0A2T3A6V4_9PEZI|nr:hypothetical protein BD289DRAFT_461102 [Coniella lustricola]
MGDRYDRSGGRRSPIYAYGRTSLPVVPTTYYAGDVHGAPAPRYEAPVVQPRHYPTSTVGSSAHHHHHNRRNSSTFTNDWRGPNVPVTTTTYTVKTDPVSRSTSVREHSRARSHTLDTASRKPPIIVTTRQTKEASSSASHASRDAPHSPNPDRERERERGRNTYRGDDGYSIAQPASSMRSRSHSRYASERDSRRTSGIMSSTLDDEEFRRLRQRTNEERLQPSWNEPRRERPSSYYANPPRYSTSTVATDLGDSGYEYTGPGALLRYDLDNDRRATYYRPTVTVNDVVRKPYDAHARGPPPTTRGLDKVNRRAVEDPTAGIYERPTTRMPAPAPVVPVAAVAAVVPPHVDRRSGSIDVIASPVDRRVHRNSHAPAIPSYQDEYPARDPRARDYYPDDDVSARGFGIRTESDKKKDIIREEYAPARERRRDSRLEDRESRRHSEEDNERLYERPYGREHGKKEDPVRPEKKGSREDSVRDDDRDKVKLRDKVATGLSLAAGAIGLGGALGHGHREDSEDKGSPRRRTEEETHRDEDEERLKPAKREAEDRPREDSDVSSRPADKPRKDRDRDRGRDRDRDRDQRDRDRDRDRDPEDVDDSRRHRRDAEARLTGEAPSKDTNSSSDETKPRRRGRPASGFKPNDTASLMALKEQLRAQEEADSEHEKSAKKKEVSPERRNSPPSTREDVDELAAGPPRDDLRGRDASVSAADDKQVRLVSPPRDKDDKKPIKGILKQPKPQFPEEPNPIREGVAPHKDDKTKGNVPPGARWTKISRKLVNPEALTIGKERFEVRDDFVIVLRVLNKEEIEAYTAATAQLREMRRQEFEEREKEDERDDDDDRRRPHRSHRRDPRDEDDDEERRRREEKRERDRDRDRDRERDREPRSRRHRHEDDEPLRLEYSTEDRDRIPTRSHRHREREREREREPVSVRND